jgi:hypothetical protein
MHFSCVSAGRGDPRKTPKGVATDPPISKLLENRVFPPYVARPRCKSDLHPCKYFLNKGDSELMPTAGGRENSRKERALSPSPADRSPRQPKLGQRNLRISASPVLYGDPNDSLWDSGMRPTSPTLRFPSKARTLQAERGATSALPPLPSFPLDNLDLRAQLNKFQPNSWARTSS